MNSALVGYTGFVGSNLALSHPFTNLYNSQNIKESYGSKPDFLVYAGVPSKKFLANQKPEEDFYQVKQAYKNILKINPKKLVLISTIDVYGVGMIDCDETAIIDIGQLHPYGAHRLWLEKNIRKSFPHALVLRLPALFGKNIKKNFIYDFIHIIPSMLCRETYSKLVLQERQLDTFYQPDSRGYHVCRILSDNEKHILKEIFKRINYSALNLTDSRGIYQFYNLNHLWEHLIYALNKELTLINLVTEPVSIEELYVYLKDETFTNHIVDTPPKYQFKTIYDRMLGGNHGYLFSKQAVMKEIKQFIEEQVI